MFEPCVTHADCVVNEVCFQANDSWSNRTMCFCNTFYGFSGPDCGAILSEPNAIFIFVMGILGVIVCTGFWILSMYNLVLLTKATPRERRKITQLDPVLLTTVYFSIAGVILVAYAGILIAVPLLPFDPTYSDDESTMYLDGVSQNLLAIALVALAAGIMSIALGFIEMTVNISKRRRRMVRAFGVVYKFSLILVVVILLGLRKIYLALLISFPFVIVLALAYILGLSALTRKIEKRSDLNDKALRSLKGIQKTILVLCLFLVAEIAIAGIWSISSHFIGWEKLTPPGTLSICVAGYVIWLPAVLSGFTVLRDINKWRKIRVRQQSRPKRFTTSSSMLTFPANRTSTTSLSNKPPQLPNAKPSSTVPLSTNSNSGMLLTVNSSTSVVGIGKPQGNTLEVATV